MRNPHLLPLPKVDGRSALTFDLFMFSKSAYSVYFLDQMPIIMRLSWSLKEHIQCRILLSTSLSRCFKSQSRYLSSLATLRPAASDALRLGPLQMGGRNPTLVIGLGAGRHRWAVLPDDRSLIGWVDDLATTRGLLRALTALAATLLLREQRRDPGVVDEVTSSAETGCKEEVEEDAAAC